MLSAFGQMPKFLLWISSAVLLVGLFLKLAHIRGSLFLLGIGFVLLALHFLLDFIFTSKKLE